MESKPLSPRLLAAAELVPVCGVLADIGTDHGLLPIWLAGRGRAGLVYACDIGRGPLDSARRNIRAAGLQDRVRCLLSDGFANCPRDLDCAVIAGMGGETIQHILAEAPWLTDRDRILILQPQTKLPELLAWLPDGGWALETARLVRDSERLYIVLRCHPGESAPLSPAERYAPPQLVGDPLLGGWLDGILRGKRRAAAGLRQGGRLAEAEEEERLIAALEQKRKDC